MAAPSTVRNDVLPPLEQGDRLTRADFHRLYSLHHEIHKAELVEGVVHVPSPLSIRHGRPQGRISRWIAAFLGEREDLDFFENLTVVLDEDNEFQPDACLVRPGGGTTEGADGYLHGPPELVIEVSVTSASYDLHAKKNAYRRNGVPEYIVWRVYDGAIDWFILREGEYRQLEADAGGTVHSEVFPGLRLNVAAMLAGNIRGVLATQLAGR